MADTLPEVAASYVAGADEALMGRVLAEVDTTLAGSRSWPAIDPLGRAMLVGIIIGTYEVLKAAPRE
jgi:hypothetical protein